MRSYAFAPLLALAVSFAHGQAPTAATSTTGATTTQAAATQELSQEQTALFDRIRAGYYHPGKIALACDGTLDFSEVLAKMGDMESAKLLNGLKLHVTTSDSGPTSLTFTWPDKFPVDSRPQVEMGAKQVVGGFFQAYWPIVNAEVLPATKDHPTVAGVPGGGYTISAGTGSTTSQLTVDSDAMIHRVLNHTGGQDATLMLSYTPSPNPQPGDLKRFTGLTVDRATGTAIRIQAEMHWDEQDVAGVHIPHRITIGIPGAFSVPVTLSECAVSPAPVVPSPN